MRTPRIATVCVALVAATLVSGSALARDARTPAPPKNLHGFLLKPNEPLSHVFSRTPAFSWAPVRGAYCYEFELATSKGFSSNSVIWSNVQEQAGSRACQAVPADMGATTGSASDPTPAPAPGTTTSTTTPSSVIPAVRVPAVSVDLVLPWFTGNPYAVFARVRAVTANGPTRWSTSFGFNMRWQSRPAPRKATAGLVRWSTVEGATGYQVWYPKIGKSFSTNTNVADLRDFYTFHRGDANWWRTVQWRVRAVRRISGTIANGLPSVSYGQWSPTFVGANPPLSSGPIRLQAALSDRASTRSGAKAHELMPAFSFTGDSGFDRVPYNYFRVYVATDRDCVNVVFRGSVIGSPAFAARTSGPLKLPVDEAAIAAAEARPFPKAIPDDAIEGTELTWLSDWRPVTASETLSATTTTTTPPAGAEAPPTDESQTVVQARVDLPDVDFPSTRYFWTVVPVDFQQNPSYDDTATKKKMGYIDVESPQDACQAGRVMSFGKESDPAVTGSGNGAPFVSGLSPNGRFMNTSRTSPTVFSTPLIAWKPATGATAYQVQWSRSRYPWRAAGLIKTFATSAVLDLPAGKWYYRVRGLNQTQLRRAEMAWSLPVTIRVAPPRFSIAR